MNTAQTVLRGSFHSRSLRDQASVLAFQKHGPLLLDRQDFKLDQKLEGKPGKPRIRCPHCLWQPQKSSSWSCVAAGPPENFRLGCGFSWNTFDTRGRCPGCRYQWRHTMCLACQKWALHDAWYEKQSPRKD